jgi:hypothetical protein
MSTDDIRAHRRYIEKALESDGGTYTFEDVEDAIRAGKFQCWPTPNAVIITQVVQYPRKKICHVFLVAGKRDEVVAMLQWVELWARGIGCARMEGSGRMGWAKHALSKRLGWTIRQVCLEKDLGEEQH